MLQQTKFALGSDALLTIVGKKGEDEATLMENLWEEIDAFEDRFSRFRLDSELTNFNQNAGKKTPITAAFRELLIKSKQLAEDTDGLYNPFILPALQRAGYVGSWPNYKEFDSKLDYSKRNLKDIDALKISKDWALIPADSALDTGGIGKGYLLDQLAVIAKPKCAGYWFSLGGDIVAEGFDDEKRPWRIGIQAANHPNTQLAHVENKAGKKIAVATSGITKRQGTHDDRKWNHLIDPRTGDSTETDLLTASVVAKEACLADVIASCVVLLGRKDAKELLLKRKLSGLMQTNIITPYSQGLLLVGDEVTIKR